MLTAAQLTGGIALALHVPCFIKPATTMNQPCFLRVAYTPAHIQWLCSRLAGGEAVGIYLVDFCPGVTLTNLITFGVCSVASLYRQCNCSLDCTALSASALSKLFTCMSCVACCADALVGLLILLQLPVTAATDHHTIQRQQASGPEVGLAP